MKKSYVILSVFATIFSGGLAAASPVNPPQVNSASEAPVSDAFIAAQRAKLLADVETHKSGPQSPRDIDKLDGANPIVFSAAPPYQTMNLCNIHIHKGAEHKSAGFDRYIGNGDGKGFESGYKTGYTGPGYTPSESTACASEHSTIEVGDTIEVHFVYTTAPATPGPKLDSCIVKASEDPTKSGIVNPQLRVEGRVFQVSNGNFSFTDMTKLSVQNGYHQANHKFFDQNLVQYAGSTTGPDYNEVASPYQVTWSVSKFIWGIDIKTLDTWCKDNVFKENHAHGVRNLITDPKLLSKIQ